ncbi:MAG: ROK family protein [Candidatus Omnitrophica bacterium]|nr:ROK family protein [Candidatus Omnitrophota bacterium]
MARNGKKYVVGVDLGGTKMLAALLDDRFEIKSLYKAAVEPNRGEKFFFKTLGESIETVLSGKVSIKDVRSIGLGCPGIIHAEEGVVRISPNISFMKNYPLGEKLRRHFGVPVAVENDVNAGLYGEQQFGAAKGYKHVFGIFLGTGVGGAMILDGRIYRGATGAAGEIGHTFLSLPSFLAGAQKAGTVEDYLGRLRISSEAMLLVMKQKAPNLLESTEYDIRKIKSKALARSAHQDEAVRELIADKASILGIAMANVVNLLSPELIVLGGGMVEAMGDLLLPAARQVMQEYAMRPLAVGVKVSPAKLKDFSIVKGAAKLGAEAAASRKTA